MDERFRHSAYTVRRTVFKIFGGSYYIYDPQGNLVFFSELKAFKLKEDIGIFGDKDKQERILSIKARKVLDISATYDVVDNTTGEKIGALKRSGLKSMIRDEWLILDNNDQETGKIVEDNLFLALIRRFLSNLIPQKYQVTINSRPVAIFKQNFNPFVLKLHLDFSQDPQYSFDRRLAIASSVLITGIEGRQR